MLVFGDAAEELDVWARLNKLTGAAQALLQIDDDQRRYWAATEAFLNAAELAQGLIDMEFEAEGVDAETPLRQAATGLVMSIAKVLANLWRGEPCEIEGIQAAMAKLAYNELPQRVVCRRPEGYAFYALYPEAYLDAAAALAGAPAKIVGIRSIGLGLAALVAAASEAGAPISVRPVGHPFHRQLALSPALRERLLEQHFSADFAVADEGPGLSGSSFAAVIDLLVTGGIDVGRIHLFPSHAGPPGAEAPAPQRQRWERMQRHVVDFDALHLGSPRPERRLDNWFTDITGPPLEPLRDISGGQWRAEPLARAGLWPPAHVQQERRKFLLTTERGSFLLKFAGLGRYGREKFERGRRLSEAGFVPEMLGFAHGFTLERWEAGGPVDILGLPPDRLLAHIGDYLGFRAAHFPLPRAPGADREQLSAMLHQNGVEALGEGAARPLSKLAACASGIRPPRVATDNRLHAWEWLMGSNGRLLKADAIDHCAAHDLIGAQDIFWDVAGAGVELGLSTEARDELAARVGHAIDTPTEARALAFTTGCYLAFQLGYYTMAAAALAGMPEESARLQRRADFYKLELARLLEEIS